MLKGTHSGRTDGSPRSMRPWPREFPRPGMCRSQAAAPTDFMGKSGYWGGQGDNEDLSRVGEGCSYQMRRL